MAATGRSRFPQPAGALLLAVMIITVSGAHRLRAEQADEIRSRLGDIANALTGGNPSDAMTPFSKSFAEYDTLRGYFAGLVDAFSIVNEVDILDEEDSQTGAVVTVRWSLTLRGAQEDASTQRSADIRIRFIREKKEWKIVEFAPLELFDPARAQTPTKLPGG